MKKLLLLAMLALLGAFAARGRIEALTSPISPVHPPGLQDCPRACIENLIGVGYPTCNAWCVDTYDLDLAAELVSPHVPPRPTPAPPGCERPGWYRISDWMGIYPLWTDGAGYCLEGR